LRDVVWGEKTRMVGHRGNGGLIVQYEETCSKSLCIHSSLRFTLSLWPNEPVAEIQRELDGALRPIVERIYSARRGRARPLSPRVKLPVENGEAALRRF
jgi:hypothetical protein